MSEIRNNTFKICLSHAVIELMIKTMTLSGFISVKEKFKALTETVKWYFFELDF